MENNQTRILTKTDIVFFYIAPILMLASTLIKSFDGIENVKAGITSGVVQGFAFITYVFVFDRLFHYSARQLPVFSAVFRVIFVVCCFVGFCFGLDAILLEMTGNEYTFWAIPGAQIFAFLGIVWPLSLVITGITFWVKKVIPASIAVLIAICGIAFPAGRIPGIAIVYYIADVLFLITFWMLGRHLSANYYSE